MLCGFICVFGSIIEDFEIVGDTYTKVFGPRVREGT